MGITARAEKKYRLSIDYIKFLLDPWLVLFFLCIFHFVPVREE